MEVYLLCSVVFSVGIAAFVILALIRPSWLVFGELALLGSIWPLSVSYGTSGVELLLPLFLTVTLIELIGYFRIRKRPEIPLFFRNKCFWKAICLPVAGMAFIVCAFLHASWASC